MSSINILGFEAQFIVGNPVVINVPLLDVTSNPVTGRTYPGSLVIQLWKAGVIDSSAQLSTITSVEIASGIYRTTIPGALINTPLTDYLLVVNDSSNIALPQRVEFSAFKISGFQSRFVVGNPVAINIPLLDSSNNPVTDRTYPGSLGIQLWKGGYDSSAQLFSITATETAAGVYRTTIPSTLVTTAGIDYELIMSDSSNVGLTQRIQFSPSVSGPRTVTIAVEDSFTTLPISDTQVYIKDSSNTLLVYNGMTDVSGKYTAGLTDGTYNLTLVKSFVGFTTPISLVVSSDTTSIYLGTTFNPLSPLPPQTCVVYGWVSGMDGIPVRNAKVTVNDPINTSYSGSFKIGKISKVASTDPNGYWELNLIRNSQLTPSGVPYQITQTYPGYSYQKDIIVPDTSSSVEFSTL